MLFGHPRRNGQNDGSGLARYPNLARTIASRRRPDGFADHPSPRSTFQLHRLDMFDDRVLAGVIVWPPFFTMDTKGAVDTEIASLQSRQEYLSRLAEQRCAGEAAQTKQSSR